MQFVDSTQYTAVLFSKEEKIKAYYINHTLVNMYIIFLENVLEKLTKKCLRFFVFHLEQTAGVKVRHSRKSQHLEN